MKSKNLSLFLALATSLAVCAPCFTVTASAEEGSIFSNGEFEEEPIIGWSMLGGTGALTIDTANKHGGNSSLHVAGREATWNGPCISLDGLVEPLESYRFSGWVYADSKAEEAVNCTLKFTDSVNVDSYVGISTIITEPGEWTHFEGTVETPEDMSSTLLYFESSNVDLEFNIDSIEIFGKAPEAQAEETETETVDRYEFDFENGFDEWISRGETRLIRTDEQHLSGNYSMLSTNRQKTWNGPTVAVDGIARDTEYTYEASVLYTDKKVDDSIEFLIEVQYSYNGAETYDIIASDTAVRNEWVTITGTHTIPYGATNVMFYVQTSNLPEGVPAEKATPTDLVSFYVDDISIMRSDLVGRINFDLKKTFDEMSLSTLLLIIAAVVVLIVIIVVVARLSSRDDESVESEEEKKEAAESEKVNDVLDALDGNTDREKARADVKKAEAKEASKAAEKAEKTEEAKEEKSEASDSQDSKKKSKKAKKAEARSKEIFSTETFSYDDPDAATAAPSDDNSDPLDSPFDGF